MNTFRNACIISFVIHCTAVGLIYALGLSRTGTHERIVIDFTVNDSPASAALQPATPPVPAHQQASERRMTVKNLMRAPAPRIPAKTPQATPAPALDPRGIVPVSDPPRKTPDTSTTRQSAETRNTATDRASAPAPPGTEMRTAPPVEESTEHLRKRYLKEHYAYIKDIIQRNLAYPPMARKMGWTGRVVVTFHVLENGQVKDISIVKGCNHEILDRNVIETIRSVAPFPKPPAEVTLTIPVAYEF